MTAEIDNVLHGLGRRGVGMLDVLVLGKTNLERHGGEIGISLIGSIRLHDQCIGDEFQFRRLCG